ncbi:MAG: exonuclease SbcCD subunit D [Dehalococcoidia bacterium]|nr:exonuclease SbcCD subunit D [Dehalococcoidia bacterium]
MRLLHTADWHLGRTIRGRSRVPEFDAVLQEVTGVAIEEGVDVFLVAGDIFDTMSPPPEAERLLYSALRRLVEAKIDIVLVAGNHDNPRRLAALGQLADLLGVHAQSHVRRWDEGGTVRLERNGEQLRLAALPWVPEGRALNAEEILGPSFESYQGYAEFVGEVYQQATQGFEDGAINVFAAHVFVDGSKVATIDGSERRIHIGQTYAVMPSALPGHAQYVALGHVHEPQVVLGAPNNAATYSGSLLQLDFGEAGQEKIVRIVDLEPGRPARHRPVALTSGKQLAEVRGTFEEVVAQGERLGDAYLRATVRLDGPTPGLAQRVRDALPNCVDVRIEQRRDAEDLPEALIETLTPTDLYVRYYQYEHGQPPSPETLAVFREVLEEATVQQ